VEGKGDPPARGGVAALDLAPVRAYPAPSALSRWDQVPPMCRGAAVYLPLSKRHASTSPRGARVAELLGKGPLTEGSYTGTRRDCICERRYSSGVLSDLLLAEQVRPLLSSHMSFPLPLGSSAAESGYGAGDVALYNHRRAGRAAASEEAAGCRREDTSGGLKHATRHLGRPLAGQNSLGIVSPRPGPGYSCSADQPAACASRGPPARPSLDAWDSG